VLVLEIVFKYTSQTTLAIGTLMSDYNYKKPEA